MKSTTTYSELSANIVVFCRLLRDYGVSVGPSEETDALRAIELIEIGNSDMFRLTLRAVLTRNLQDQEIFDLVFPGYWQDLQRETSLKNKQTDKPQNEIPSQPKKEPKTPEQLLKNWSEQQQENEDEIEISAYSSLEILVKKNFSNFEADEIDRVMKIIVIIAKSLANKLSRRYKQSHRNGVIDLRKTMRLSLRRGGEMIDIAFRRRRIQRLKLVMLCDVSKSMDLYSRFLVQFIYVFQNLYRRIETFVFSTSLYQVTDILKGRDFSEVLQEVAKSVPGWSGGTRIGTALDTYLKEYSRSTLDSNTVFLIMSDGWDTGDIDLLKNSMKEIYKRAGYVIWLNPLMGYSNYEPICQGMNAALPYIDIFAPVHNVESLRDLTYYLSRTQEAKRFKDEYTTQIKKEYAYERPPSNHQ